jgi:hypothetical protein
MVVLVSLMVLMSLGYFLLRGRLHKADFHNQGNSRIHLRSADGLIYARKKKPGPYVLREGPGRKDGP